MAERHRFRSQFLAAIVMFGLLLPACRHGGYKHTSKASDPLSAESPVLLVRAHAHNDYLHDRPLLDALDHGFNSVEADVHLVEGRLLVAHDRDQVREDRTLQSLYLDPLRGRIRKNNGRVHRNGPTFTLLVDLKSQGDATYEVLGKVLGEYKDILTSFGPRGRQENAVVVILSGNRPRKMLESEKVRYAAMDGRLGDLEYGAPATLIPLISDRWGRNFTWSGEGSIPREERRELREIVAKAHQYGRRVRFWATPDSPGPRREAFWNELRKAGVDLINTDDLAGLREFLLEHDR